MAAGACAALDASLVSAPGLSRTAAAGAPPSLAAAVPGQIRVNQQGYLPLAVTHQDLRLRSQITPGVRHGPFRTPRGGTR